MYLKHLNIPRDGSKKNRTLYYGKNCLVKDVINDWKGLQQDMPQTFIVERTELTHAVFPVPGTPLMYRQPDFPATRVPRRKSVMVVSSCSRHGKSWLSHAVLKVVRWHGDRGVVTLSGDDSWGDETEATRTRERNDWMRTFPVSNMDMCLRAKNDRRCSTDWLHFGWSIPNSRLGNTE